MIPNILSIAGSDPSGGAGIQADLKTFSALGAYGMAAMTALTAQNTTGVSGVHYVPAEFVAAQVRMVFEDIRVDAVKTGMAGTPDSIEQIALLLGRYKPAHIVVDPVMVAQSGASLSTSEGTLALKNRLVPLATLLTPNIPEAEALLGRAFAGDMEEFAQALLALGPKAVYLKGGHLSGADSTDLYTDGTQVIKLTEARIETKNNHGTGCTLASALAVFLAQGVSAEEAACKGKKYITETLRNAYKMKIGKGNGPVHHFYDLWD